VLILPCANSHPGFGSVASSLSGSSTVHLLEDATKTAIFMVKFSCLGWFYTCFGRQDNYFSFICAD
jgi:hypothetical protein